MKFLIRETVIFLTLLSLFLSSCSQDSGPQGNAVAKPASTSAEVEARAQAKEHTTEKAAGLAGTSWQLVQIMSMDDNTYSPEDPSLYKLNFGADGSMSVLADCNRGSGSWISESGSQLEFGPIAATMALCPPGSLHDRYLSQFEWVRSYVLRDGHLFLATMADGSIIEFEPAEND